MSHDMAVERKYLADLAKRDFKTTIAGEGGFSLAYSLGAMDYAFADEGCRNFSMVRRVQGLFREAMEPAGYCIFKQWEFDRARRLWNTLEDDGYETEEFGEMLAANWSRRRLPNLLVFEELWIRPEHAKRGRWAPAVNTLIARISARNDIAVLVLKPFPLEYQGAPGDGPDDTRSRRFAAMRRHYAHWLGAREMPGSADWMWSQTRQDRPSAAPYRTRRSLGNVLRG